MSNEAYAEDPPPEMRIIESPITSASAAKEPIYRGRQRLRREKLCELAKIDRFEES
tara:strand:+ start:550 stop:717 length:168 start_codon:yes stop_codon:yes gene_type:complete